MARELLSSDSSDSDEGGAQLDVEDFKVNQNFARKFEHNKKREEKQRLEEKLGKSLKRKRNGKDDGAGLSSDESTSESEDEGDLATAALDSEILATISAIRSKDPRVYDENAQFYKALDVNDHTALPIPKAEKPMHLRDYHRQKLLNGIGDEEEDDGAGQPLTYNQEQEQLKQSVVKEIQAAAGTSDSESGKENSESEFLIAKEKPKVNRKEPVLDVDSADRDPETYLSNFMASRAWTQTDQWKLQPFESDDDEEERRAEEFEQAYNMRFEDPAKSNEKLQSHARDLAAKHSVRRDEVNPRQKRREAEKSKKEAVRQELRDDKARLRKLRIGEVEEKIRRIKRAAGLHTKDIQPEDWSRFVDEEWDDVKWEEEMQRRFGEKYYAEGDVESSNEDEQQTKRKVKKPKFDDDIDIKDIVPGYEDEDEPNFSLSDEDLPYADGSRSKSEKKHKRSKENTDREARKERRLIEQLVDAQLQLEVNHGLPKSESKEVGFRYRQTSPQSFGLTSRDILMADDSNLNQYAGLKKLAAFRDADKKRKDQKHLGKKARLRKWRKEVFGNEDGLPASELLPFKSEANGEADLREEDGGVDIVTTGKKRKKRRRNNNNKEKTATVDV